jgi:glycosyltransferase involved in cell wall biosynthesis
VTQTTPFTDLTARAAEDAQTGQAPKLTGGGRALLFVDNDLGTFLWHRLALARAARNLGFQVHVATPPNPQAASLAKDGFVFHPIPLTRRGINPFREVLTVVALRRLYRRLKPDLIHHLRLKPVLYGTLAARLAGRPAVANSLTGLGYVFSATGRKVAALRRIAQLGLRFALRHKNSNVIFENPDDRRTFVESGLVSEGRTSIVAGSGVDIDFFQQTPFPGGTPLVILASRMLWDKGVGEFVEAARIIAARGVRARFALVGDTDAGNPSAVPREQLQKWRDEGVIEWWGFRRDIQAVLGQSHVVCLPSSYGEGIPRILIEAASCGRPLVATDAPGCREIVRDKLNGFLVPVKDAESLANALHKLVIDEELRIRMGANGRKLVLTRFTLKQVLASNLAVYAELLSTAGSGGPTDQTELINLLTAVSGGPAGSGEEGTPSPGSSEAVGSLRNRH